MKMSSLLGDLTEDQLEWVYTIIGLIFAIVGIGWVIFVDDPLLRILVFLPGFFSGYFLFIGKLKPLLKYRIFQPIKK